MTDMVNDHILETVMASVRSHLGWRCPDDLSADTVINHPALVDEIGLLEISIDLEDRFGALLPDCIAQQATPRAMAEVIVPVLARWGERGCQLTAAGAKVHQFLARDAVRKALEDM